MDCAGFMTAWAKARKTAHDNKAENEAYIDAFYEALEDLTGLSPSEIRGHFADWNDMTHDEAIEIAERHGVSVHEGGFQAYLADVTQEGESEWTV